jgi:cbb3-type cytochrome oxidase maturation protein
LDVDILIYVIGAFLMAGISVGFVVWGLKTGQFGESVDLNRRVLEEDEEEE